MTVAKVSELDPVALTHPGDPGDDGIVYDRTPTVEYHGAQLPAFCHMYNMTWLNERGAELAVVTDFLARLDAEHDADAGLAGLAILEVGNVCAHYGIWDPVVAEGGSVTIVDRYEPAPYVDNIDVFDVTGTWDVIVAVSTLEHVRWDEPDIDRQPGASAEAVELLARSLAPGGRMLVTVPTGHNPPFDQYLRDDVLADRSCTLVRDMVSWRQTPEPDFRPYGVTQAWAEAVWIGEWHHPDPRDEP